MVKALTWKPILSNLTEANGELKKLLWRLHYLAFGELPEDCPNHADASELDWYARREKCSPFAEGSLFASLEHAYFHLNLAWSCRCTPEDRVWRFADRDADSWMKFPDTASFSDLWPSDRTDKVAKDAFGLIVSGRRTCLFPLGPEIQLAQHKLNNLCHLVAKECFGEEKVAVPKGMMADVWKRPLTEKEFARRLHRIYGRLNTAWNCRVRKNYPKGGLALQQLRCFSPCFATGSFDMWR